MCNLGNALWPLGRLIDARACYERGIVLARELGDRNGEANILQSLVELSEAGGDTATTEQRLAKTLELRRAMGQRHHEAEAMLTQGALLARQARTDEAIQSLGEALLIARDLPLPAVTLLATAWRATLPRGDVGAALAALAAQETRVEVRQAMEARFLVWRAARDRTHLIEAKRLLDYLVAHAPPDCRESMIANVRLHREIATAAREDGL